MSDPIDGPHKYENCEHNSCASGEAVKNLVEEGYQAHDGVPSSCIAQFRSKWQQAVTDTSDGLPADEVFRRLAAKYTVHPDSDEARPRPD